MPSQEINVFRTLTIYVSFHIATLIINQLLIYLGMNLQEPMSKNFAISSQTNQ